MKARDVMTAPVLCCSVHDTLEDVAELMWEYEIHAVPVVDSAGRPVGWVTDRAICMSALRARRALGSVRVAQAMLQSVPTVQASLKLSVLERRVMGAGWLVVVDEAGVAEGVVTDGDLQRARVATVPHSTRANASLQSACPRAVTVPPPPTVEQRGGNFDRRQAMR